jgi:RND family efflux transporter MFP subunit
MIRSTLTFSLMAVLAVGCGTAEEEVPASDGSAAEQEVDRTLVEFATLSESVFEESIELVGVTQPIREANIAAEVPGRIIRFDVEEGQLIERGDSVLRLDMATATASIGQLDAQIAQIDQDIARNRALVERGIGTSATVEQLEAQRRVVEENIRQIRTNIRQGSSTAPISGIVTQTMAEPGEYASPGQPLARIVDISTIRVFVGLPEREISYVHPGMRVAVRIEATGEALTGTLHQIAIEANPANRTFPLEIRLDNAAGSLRAGMRASVVIPKDRIDDAVVIPRDAILQGIDGPEALVLSSGGSVEVRELTIGPGRGSFVVAMTGLQVGDQLIVRGHRGLVPGEPVEPIDVGACCSEQFSRFLRDAGEEAEESGSGETPDSE